MMVVTFIQWVLLGHVWLAGWLVGCRIVVLFLAGVVMFSST